MLTGIHFLLTYACNQECDHCFVYSGPNAKGTFTLDQLEQVYEELVRLGTIDWVYFEGGEPFLFYPLMVEGIRMARDRGFRTGIVTNSYWATSVEDAELWLRPIQALDLADLSVSDDAFHSDDVEHSLAKNALTAARKMGLPVGSICIEEPRIEMPVGEAKGSPVVGGGAMLRGRAVEKLVGGLPTRPYTEFTECPYENLRDPERVHLDATATYIYVRD
ncbi:MAG: radical SAM protein [Chloroflexi bacterium]|nr:radical SAM protein [Chloroflexota bacterium]